MTRQLKLTGRLTLLSCLSAASITGGVPALAQTGQGQTVRSAPVIDEVLVTARRREERSQDVPVSLTAFSGEQLAQRGVETAMDLGKTAPSLTVSPSPRGSNTPYFTMRGQRLIDTSLVLDPVTVVYFNEIPYMRPQGLNGGLFDIQSVQVLRGPQGTLFGRNTTGGAVLVTSKQPTNELEGDLAVRGGKYNALGFEGAVNVPIGEKAALRIAATSYERDGYTKNRATGYRSNDQDYHAARVTLKLQPSESLTSTFTGNYFHSDDHGSMPSVFAVNPITPIAAIAPALQAEAALNDDSPYTFGSNMRGRERARARDISNVTVWEISPALSLKNIAGYRDVETHSAWDLDGSSFFVQDTFGNTDVHQFSEELQLLGASESFDWLVGAFYFREKGSDIATNYQGGSPTLARPGGVLALNKSYSAFVSGTYRFGTSGFSTSVGVRYTKDERSGYGKQQVGDACTFRLNNGQTIDPPCLYPMEATFKEPSWSVSLNYKITEDTLVYLAHRHGYRSGGIQSRAASEAAALPFDPEKVNDIELGVKSDFSIGPVQARLNADVYYAKYKDLQRQVSFVVPATGSLVSGLFNAASSKVKGVEVELTLLPVDGLEISGSAGYVDPKYKRFTTFSALGAPVDISDWPFAYVPDWTVNARVAYTLPLASTVGEVRLAYDYRYQSGIITSDTPQPMSEIPNFSVSDVRVDWNDIAGSTIGASAFVTNVFDKVYYTFGTSLTSALGMGTRYIGAPRMWGVEARMKF